MDATLTARAERLAREMAASAGTIDDLNVLMRTMMKSALECMLDAEMDHHLAASRAATLSAPRSTTAIVEADTPIPSPTRPNRRNGRSNT